MDTAYEMSYRMGILDGRTAKRFATDGKTPGVGVTFKDHGDLLSAVDPYAEGYRAGLNDTAPARRRREKGKTMISICAWCKKVMGEKEPLDDKRETHGICPECKEKLKQ